MFVVVCFTRLQVARVEASQAAQQEPAVEHLLQRERLGVGNRQQWSSECASAGKVDQLLSTSCLGWTVHKARTCSISRSVPVGGRYSWIHVHRLKVSTGPRKLQHVRHSYREPSLRVRQHLGTAAGRKCEMLVSSSCTG